MFPKGVPQFLLILIISLIVCLPLIYLLNVFFENQNLITSLFYTLFLLIFISLIHLINYKRGIILQYNIKPIRANFLFFSILIIWIIQTVFFLPMKHYLNPNKIFNSDLFFLLTALFVGPVLEEIVFRNILLKSLLNRYSIKKSILISSFIFAIIHVNPFQILVAFILGVFFGFVYSNNRNILSTIILHIFANIFGVLGQYFVFNCSENHYFIIIIGLNGFISLSVISFMWIKYRNIYLI